MYLSQKGTWKWGKSSDNQIPFSCLCDTWRMQQWGWQCGCCFWLL